MGTHAKQRGDGFLLVVHHGKARANKASSTSKAAKFDRKKPLKKRSKKVSPQGARRLPRVVSDENQKEPIAQVLSNSDIKPSLKVTDTPLTSEAFTTGKVPPGSPPSMVGTIVVPPTSPPSATLVPSASLTASSQQASSNSNEVAQLALLSAVQQANQAKKQQQEQAPVLETGLLAWQVLHNNAPPTNAPNSSAQASTQEQELAALVNQLRTLQNATKNAQCPVSSVVDLSTYPKLLEAEMLLQGATRNTNASTEALLVLLAQAQVAAIREVQQQALASALLQGSLQPQPPANPMEALLASILAPQPNQAQQAPASQPDLNALAALQLALGRQF